MQRESKTPACGSSPAPISIGAGGLLRLATPRDDLAIRRLFNKTPMQGDLVISTDRAPNFFTLYQVQDAHTECWVAERDDEVIGCASFIIRAGWLNQERKNVCYLGDLRASPRAFGLITRFYRQMLESVRSRHQVSFFYAGIMDSNLLARKALVQRRGNRKQQPVYHPMRHYDAVNLRFRSRTPKVPKGWKVRRGTNSDLAQVVTFLHEDHRNRPAGYCFDQHEFEHRLKHWPGFTLQNTYLAYHEGRLAGLCTAWDAQALKRYQVHAYRGQLKWIYRASRWLSPIFNTPKLPAPGEHFRYAYLANCSILDQNPMALRALLAKIMEHSSKEGLHFLMAYIERDSPLNQALNGFSVQRTAFTLYEVTPPKQVASALNDAPTGFEIALA